MESTRTARRVSADDRDQRQHVANLRASRPYWRRSLAQKVTRDLIEGVLQEGGVQAVLALTAEAVTTYAFEIADGLAQRLEAIEEVELVEVDRGSTH